MAEPLHYQSVAEMARALHEREVSSKELTIAHLERIEQLDSHTSRLNPLFYGLSFGMGAIAGALGDRLSLGFVAATEQQVSQHLRDHLAQLPDSDEKSRAILEQMLIDEEQHGVGALDAGGVDFAPPVKELMTLASKLMTASCYRV